MGEPSERGDLVEKATAIARLQGVTNRQTSVNLIGASMYTDGPNIRRVLRTD